MRVLANADGVLEPRIVTFSKLTCRQGETSRSGVLPTKLDGQQFIKEGKTMALTVDEQFRNFVKFARAQVKAGNAGAIARMDESGEGRVVQSTTNDKAYAFTRSGLDKDANTTTRQAFLSTLEGIFGGDKFPASVEAVMKRDDYGHGRPLTARRIMAVATEVDKFLKDCRKTNDSVKTLLEKCVIPDDEGLKSGLGKVAEDLRAKFGEAAVPKDKNILQVMGQALFEVQLKPLYETANSQNRTVTAKEIVDTIEKIAPRVVTMQVLGSRLLSSIRQSEGCSSFTAIPFATMFENRCPGLYGKLCECRNPEEVDAFFTNNAEEINRFTSFAQKTLDTLATVRPKLANAFKERSDIDSRLMTAHVPTADFFSKESNVCFDIISGKVPGSEKDDYSSTEIFSSHVEKFAEGKTKAYAAVKSLTDLPEGLADRWAAEYMTTSSSPISPQHMKSIAENAPFDDFIKVLAEDASEDAIADAVVALTKGIYAQMLNPPAGEKALKEVSPDSFVPVYTMLISYAEAKNPGFAQKVEKVRDKLDCANMICSMKEIQIASTFIGILTGKCGPEGLRPLTEKNEYLAIVKSDVEEALSGAGVTDGNLRAEITNKMLESAEAALGKAKSLEELSKLLRTFKDEALRMAQG